MKNAKVLVKKWADEISNAAKQSTTCSYVIPYSIVSSFDPTDKEAQRDVLEYLWDYKNLDENLQTVDFNDYSQLIVVMWYEPPKKEEIQDVKTVIKYTIDDVEEFRREALVVPPLEEFAYGSIDENTWYRDNAIHIIVGNHDIELEYNADNVNEIEYALREMYELEIEYRGNKNE